MYYLLVNVSGICVDIHVIARSIRNSAARMWHATGGINSALPWCAEPVLIGILPTTLQL